MMTVEAKDWQAQIPCKLDDIQVDSLDDDIVLYNPAEKKAIFLNQSAALVWELCDGLRSVGKIQGLLQESYPESEAIREDVESALGSLLDNKVVQFKS